MFGDNKINDRVATLEQQVSALAEALSGALDRLQELEVARRPPTHFSGRAPETK